MQNKARNILKYFLRNHVAKLLARKFIIQAATITGLNLLSLAYSEMGILNYRNVEESGEYYLISTWLRSFLKEKNINEACFFDVGANVGSYSESLISFFPNARIFAFEPNPETFQSLFKLSQKATQIQAINTALGDTMGCLEFYLRDNNASSVHATFYQNVLTTVHNYNDVKSLKVPVDTIDHFCSQNHIDRIDLLKIDTEGHELQVLQGARKAIEMGIVQSIQFEFNEMNIYSRSFLRDFVEILTEFNLYRLLPNTLLPIHYCSRHEIFLFQNFLAVRKDLDPYLN